MGSSSQPTGYRHAGAGQVFRVLRSRASRYALAGTLIAAVAVVLATLLVCQHIYDGISLQNVIRAHRENIAIWVLDAMPLLFAWWGQFASARMAADAGTLVEHRTDDLRQELEDARYTAQAKTDYFARMSHELRTPINAIMGMSELLMEEGDPDRRQEHARVIRDSAQGLLGLINDVLDFSRIEAGRLELDEVEFDLHDHLNGAASLLEQSARAKGLRLMALVPRDAPRRVVGDPGRLRQIAINLLGNAIKFTERGEVALSLRDWSARGDGGWRLRIEVSDTGVGIAEAEQRTLFEPYRQGRTGSGAGGTGLGLSITRELVRAMGGTISVESQPGVGSAFRFDIEVGAADEQPRDVAAEVDLRGRTLLLAEADAASRASLAGQLRALGIFVTEAGDGEAALAHARASAQGGTPFDVVLADMFLPGLSGEALGRQLKEEAATRPSCVAIMTTAGARGDAKRLKEAGFAGYLTQPIAPEQLDPLMRAIIATRDLPERERRRRGLVTRFDAAPAAAGPAPVLVVDDSAINRQISVGQLERMDLSAEAVATGEEAIEALRGRRFAAVLLDLVLPDLAGDEVTRRIRALPGNAGQVPILVLTAGSDDAARRRCEAAGADDFLVKPIAGSRLRDALAAQVMLDGPAEAAAPGARQPTDEVQALDPGLARIFRDEADQRLDALGRAVEGPDRGALGRHAHALKSASRHAACEALAEASQRLEQAAPEADAVALGEAVDAVREAWATARPDVEGAANAGADAGTTKRTEPGSSAR